jgi:hypothetical protein
MIKNKSQNLWKEIKPFFKEVGKYHKNILDKVDLEYERGLKSKVSENGLIYVLIVDDYIKYIGESKRYSRPLSYHKNNVMKDVGEGIKKEVLYNNKEVKVYIYEPSKQKTFMLKENNYELKFNNINLYKSIESYWIKLNNEQKNKGHWNNKMY